MKSVQRRERISRTRGNDGRQVSSVRLRERTKVAEEVSRSIANGFGLSLITMPIDL